MSREAFDERYEWMAGQDGYYILVVEDTARKTVVGTGALIVEKKLYVYHFLSLFHYFFSFFYIYIYIKKDRL